MQDYRKLDVWSRAHQLALAVYRHTTNFPKSELSGLTSQLRRASVSISANIAEGCGRETNSDMGRFLAMALGSASELECELLLARDLEFIGEVEHSEVAHEVGGVKRMMTSLQQRVRQAQ